MKTPTSNKAGGTPPVKKVVKKTSVKAPVQSKHGMASEPAPVFKKEGVLEIAASQVKPVETKAQGPEVSVDLKADSLHSSKALTDPRLVKLNGNNADERSAAIASDKPNEPTKPKIKTVIVKKKIVVPKKKVISAALPATEPIKTSSEANLVEKNSNFDKEAIKQQVASTGRDSTAKNPPAQETKPASLSPEKPQKGVRKTVVKGKGTTKEVKREPKQQQEVLLEISSEEPSDASKGQKAKEAESLPEDDFREEVKSVEEDEVEEGGLMDTADEAMQLYDNQEAEVEEEPAYEHHDVVEEEEGAAGGEDYHAEAMEQRPVTERQKRKKLEVFVGGLDKDATEDDLRAAFKPVGDVVEVRLMMNPMTGKNKGYAFVRFGNEEQAGRAVTEFAVTQIRGKECGVLPNQDNDTLFIGNISRDWRSSEVLQKLEEYGIDGIDDLTLIADPQNEAQNRGYAFLELATHYDAVNAFQRLQRPGVMFGYDRPPKVAWAQPLNEPDVSVMSQVKSVFVDGVPSNWTDDKVKQSFGQFGEIERIVFARNMAFAKRNDFAFVNFASRESALACTEAFREVELPDGDRKVKVKVSLARPSQKGRFDRWSIHGDYRDQGRGQAGRGEGWFRAPRFGSRRGGRGFGWSNGQGMTGRGGKRLYNEDEVLMLLRALREDEGWPSTTRGRGVRHTQVSRGTTRGAYFRNDESRQYDARRANTRSPDYRQQNDTGYTHGMYNRPASDLGTSRGRVSRPGAVRDDYEPQQQHHGPSSRSRVAHSGHYLSPRHEGAHHQRYEEGHMHGRDGGGFAGEVQDYSDLSLGMKRPVSVWDEDSSYYESNQRGYPRARIDYSDPGPVPENVSQYPGRVRSPAGPATQAVGIRQGRAGLSAREGPVSSFYDSGSGLGKSGGSSAYDDHSYNTILPETSGYLSGAPERRETSMYSSSFYGEHSGSGGYDLQAPGYY